MAHRCILAWSVSEVHQFTGKERDQETGLDFFGARYMSAAQGRFISADPSNLSVDFWYPQSWNKYTYALNNPLSFTDNNGLWPTRIHNQIIDEAFPGLSRAELQALKDASSFMDTKPGGQSPSSAFEHSMSDSPEAGAQVMAFFHAQDFTSSSQKIARNLQAQWLTQGHPGIAPGALSYFGNALHTITDATSPAHFFFQPWTCFWCTRAAFHWASEQIPSTEDRNNAINQAQAAFRATFGDDLYQRAVTPNVKAQRKPKEQVIVRICESYDEKKQQCTPGR